MRELIDCPRCEGSGFSGYGTGYDAVCDHCGGRGGLPAETPAPAEGNALERLAAGTGTADRQPEPRADLSHLVPELTRALRRISEVAASRASTGYNEAGRLAHIAAISDAALEYAEGWRCPWGCPSLMEHAADCPNLSQAEQAAGLCVEPSNQSEQG